MINKKQIEKMKKLIEQSSKILIICHSQPDGDATSSTLALRLALIDEGKLAIVGCNDPVRPNFLFMQGAEKFIVGNQLSKTLKRETGNTNAKIDLIIAVDIAQPMQIGDVYFENKSFFETRPIINIDHHSSNTMFGDVNIVDGNYVSTTEVLYDIFKELNYDLTKEIATCLLMGIISDTSRFATANVTEHAFTTSGKLLKDGADLDTINEHLIVSDSLQKAKMWGHLLCLLQTELDGKIVWASVKQNLSEDSLSPEKYGSNLAAYLRTLRGVKVSAVLFERPNRSVKVSLRGRPKVDVLSVARKFGGGGHLEGAGCIFENTTLEEAENLIIKELKILLV